MKKIFNKLFVLVFLFFTSVNLYSYCGLGVTTTITKIRTAYCGTEPALIMSTQNGCEIQVPSFSMGLFTYAMDKGKDVKVENASYTIGNCSVMQHASVQK